ncbi:MAG TPA: SusC/RagA family TonB-linked outer membrane protein [Longimicrobium sp.]|jgi:TonB-linked SusC/RagA family outer membrane protein
MRRLSRLSALLVALVAAPTALFAQGGGTITGRVTGADTNQPIASATVTVEGTALRGVTDSQGRYSIRGVPAGSYTVTAATLGRETSKRTVTVATGQTATLDFALATRAIALEGLVATATGEQQRAREVGVDVPKINVQEDIPLAATNDLSQVLQGRAAGVTVLQASGTTGTGARIRIRGSASVSLNNNPLLIIDGVRADNGNGGIDVGGQTPNRLNDINPEDIENIEILKGPAASALYGTAAANGVILVTTRKGRAGATRWSFYTEQGRITEPNEYPGNYSGFCNVRLGATNFGDIPGCDIGFALDLRSSGFTVSIDSIQTFNPLEDPATTPFDDGSRRKYGMSVTGGTDRATYYLSADFENEVGVYEDVNELNRINLRANMRGQLRDNLDVTVNTGFITSDLTLPQNDNNVLGIVSSAFAGGATQESAFGFFTIDELKNLTTNQDVQRLLTSATANYRALPWLSFNATAGMDNVQRHDNQTTLPGIIAFGSLLEGNRSSFRTNISNFTVTANGTANYGITPSVTGQTSIGTQFDQQLFRQTSASGRGLLAGCSSLNCVATGFAVDETNQDIRTLGAYIQQQFALNDRLFLTGALRGDDNSAFGADFGFIVYPSLSASWVLAEEPWFPQFDALSTLRLRTSWGQAGLRPGFRQSETFLAPTAVTVGTTSSPGFTIGGVGNPNLKPERSEELEFGFDLGLFDDRVGLEFTHYNKTSHDALIARPLAPSLGVTLSRFDNLGEVNNRGWESSLNLRLVRAANFEWDVHATYTRSRNRLVELGTDPETGVDIEPIIFGLGGDTQRHQEGFPLGAYFQQPYTFEDANNNGIIEISEVEVADSAVFLGSPFPTREASFQTNLTLFRWVKLSGLLDYRGGFRNFNSTKEFRCGTFFNCREAFAGYPGIDVSLEDQAAYIAAAYGGVGGSDFTTAAGYIEDASFVKLREVALTLGLPESLAHRLRAQGMSLTLAGRNLKTWTDYTGLDPEINGAGTGSNFNTFEFLTQPPVRYWTARIDVNF